MRHGSYLSKAGWALALSVLVFVGCRSTPPPTAFYTLTAVTKAETTGPTQAPKGHLAIGIGPVQLPGYLDRPQIVTRTTPDKVTLSEMNYPAASRGVSGTGRMPSEQPELLRMELGILFLPPLRRNVPLDLTLAPVAADRADVVPIRPELPAPQVLLHGRHPAEHLASRQTLDDSDQLGRTVRRDRLHEKVHVIPVRPNLEERNLIPRGNLQADVPEHLVDLRREHRPPVLGRTDDMVQEDGHIVAAADVLTHTPSLSQPDAASRGE